MRVIYLAETRYGSVNIASVQVVKETAKQFALNYPTLVMIEGWLWIPRKMGKDKYAVLDSLEAARLWCAADLEKQKVGLLDRIAKLDQEIDRLRGGAL